VVYLTTEKLVYLIFVGFEKTLPGFDQHLPVKCSVPPLLFGAEHYQSPKTALSSVGEHYLKVNLFHIEFCNGVGF
jgi:hypothetical protein